MSSLQLEIVNRSLELRGRHTLSRFSSKHVKTFILVTRLGPLLYENECLDRWYCSTDTQGVFERILISEAQ